MDPETIITIAVITVRVREDGRVRERKTLKL